ncbi:hypothetical protein BZY71_09895 [Leclercia adecarboxylata]|uniref:L-asparaginase n=1 Tax=Leclercia adecarboxylata TaxID=83655 RepID=A0A2C5THE8_9ENTR|nr:hypothetical protein BZY71_09895 [Leclercia adecarboxylata]PHH06813.1 L-asparaginase [Leclercia adecarboxylata]
MRFGLDHSHNILYSLTPLQAILLAVLNADSAQNPHVLYVRSGSCVLAAPRLAAPITPGDSS